MRIAWNGYKLDFRNNSVYIDLFVFLYLLRFWFILIICISFNLNFIKENRIKCVGVKGIAPGSL